MQAATAETRLEDYKVPSVDTETYARLAGCSVRTAQVKAQQGRVTSVQITGQRGRNGANYQIPVTALPFEEQLKYRRLEEGAAATDADLVAYRERYGAEGLEKLMGRLQAVQEMQLLRGDKRSAARRTELAARMGVLPRCIYDWEKKFERDGLEGLMDKTMRSDKGKSRSLCYLAQDRVNFLYMASSQLSQNKVHRQLHTIKNEFGEDICEDCCHNPLSVNRADMLARGEDPGEECTQSGNGLLVSESHCAVNRYIGNLNPALVTLGRYGKKTFDDLYVPKCRRKRPDLVNGVVYGDHHIFDLFVEIEGKAMRPWLTALMDACSNAIIGWELSFNPNTDTVVSCLASAMLCTVGSPFYGIMDALYIDNGKDYRSRRMEGKEKYEKGEIDVSVTRHDAILQTLGIEVHHAIPYRARSKTIERIFGTIETEWIRELPGWCGNKSSVRPEELEENIRRHELMTFDDFVALWSNKILPEYNSFAATKGKPTPLEIYQSTPKVRMDIPSPQLISVLKDRREERAVRPDGIYLKGKRYWHSALADLIGRRVTVLFSRYGDPSITVFYDDQCICEAETAVDFQVLGEDEDRLSEHIAMQRRVTKTALSVLQVAKNRVEIIDQRAREMPDMTMGSTITSVIHERAYRMRKEAKDKQELRKDAAQSVTRTIRERHKAVGLEVLQRPDLD